MTDTTERRKKGDFVPEKTYFVHDTVLRYDPSAPERLSKDNRVIIPLYMLQRVEARSSVSHEEEILARQVSQHFAPYEGPQLFSDGVRTKSGGLLMIIRDERSKKKTKSTGSDNDTKIIYDALAWKHIHPTERVVLVSRNMYLRLTAKALGLEAEDYRHDRIGSLFAGIADIELVDENVTDIFNVINRKPAFAIGADTVFQAAGQTHDLSPNQFCRLWRSSKKKGTPEELYCIFKASENPEFRLVEHFVESAIRKVIPRNLEQQLLYKALLDRDIRIVAAGGPAGTGKTLLAVQAGYELYRKDLFDQILVIRPHSEVGDQMGFLPGTVEQKIEPWKTPIIRSLGKVLPIIGGAHGGDSVRINGVLVSKAVQNLLNEGIVQILSTNFVQGDTFERSCIIVDEAQNLLPDAMEVLLTRIGEGSKCVITGDMRQVHNPNVKQLVSGLVDAVERLNGTNVFSYVRLEKSERDPVVQLINERYNT